MTGEANYILPITHTCSVAHLHVNEGCTHKGGGEMYSYKKSAGKGKSARLEVTSLENCEFAWQVDQQGISHVIDGCQLVRNTTCHQ